MSGHIASETAPARNSPSARFDQRWLAGALLIAILTLIAFVPALRSGYIWDDDSYLTGNRVLKQSDGLIQIWSNIRSTPQYYPLVFTTFWIEYRLWGLHPLGYHLMNVLLHAGSAVLFWSILRRLRVPGAFLGALLFALHPVHVESVAWITERKNTLSLFFYLLSAICFFEFDPIEPIEEERPRDRRIYYALSILCFIAALFSKTVTCSLPAALLVVYWWKRPRMHFRDLIPFIAMFAFGLIMAQITSWLETHHVGVKFANLGLSTADRIVLAGQIFWFYLGKLVWPWPLIFIYEKWKVDSHQAIQWIPTISFVALAAILYLLRRRIGKAPLVVLLLYAMTLTPALGFVDVYPMVFSWVADHFQYHASLAPIAAIGAILGLFAAKTMSTFSENGSLRDLGMSPRIIPAAIIVLIFGVLTWNQGLTYADSETLWRRTLAKNDKAVIGHNNLGALLSTVPTKEKEAEQHLWRAIELNPRHGHAYVNLAVIAMNHSEFEKAEEYLNKALERVSESGGSAELFHNLGLCAAHRKNWDEAAKNYQLALSIRPDYGPAMVSMSDCLLAQGKDQEARKWVEAAIKIDPDAIEKYVSFGVYNLSKGETRTAIRYLEIALMINPDHLRANYNLASLLSGIGRDDEAISYIKRAIASAPDLADAHNVLGVILTNQGKPDQAILPLTTATRLDPNNPDAQFNLANAYAAIQQMDQALVHYREVLRLRPDDPDAREIIELITKKDVRLRMSRERVNTSGPTTNLPVTSQP